MSSEAVMVEKILSIHHVDQTLYVLPDASLDIESMLV
jgi:hypothetical protein